MYNSIHVQCLFHIVYRQSTYSVPHCIWTISIVVVMIYCDDISLSLSLLPSLTHGSSSIEVVTVYDDINTHSVCVVVFYQYSNTGHYIMVMCVLEYWCALISVYSASSPMNIFKKNIHLYIYIYMYIRICLCVVLSFFQMFVSVRSTCFLCVWLLYLFYDFVCLLIWLCVCVCAVCVVDVELYMQNGVV
jgi:hypothetical protein